MTWTTYSAPKPCECDLYLRCSKFFTTSEYAPRLRARMAREGSSLY
jgi:hypothetical protein